MYLFRIGQHFRPYEHCDSSKITFKSGSYVSSMLNTKLQEGKVKVVDQK